MKIRLGISWTPCGRSTSKEKEVAQRLSENEVELLQKAAKS